MLSCVVFVDACIYLMFVVVCWLLWVVLCVGRCCSSLFVVGVCYWSLHVVVFVFSVGCLLVVVVSSCLLSNVCCFLSVASCCLLFVGYCCLIVVERC